MSVDSRTERLVALTGANGFIGRHAAQRLIAAGLRLRILAREPARLPGWAAETEVIAGSLEDRATIERLVSGADAVLHIAGVVRGATREQFDAVNAHGAQTCAAAASAAGVPRLLLISSLAAREPQLSAYAASKRAGEERVAGVAGNMPVTVIRPPAVYGPGDTEMLPLFRLMARGLAMVPGSAAARFSLIFAEDLARAILEWTIAHDPPAGTWEIDDGRQGGYDWPEVCATVSGLTGRPVRQIRLPGLLLDLPAALNYVSGRLGLTSPMLTPGKLRELRHPDWVCRAGMPGALPDWKPRFRLSEGLLQTPGWQR